MPVYSDSVLEEIREAADLVSVVSQHVALKRVGKSYAGLCPFHKEKTPSFNVNPHKRFYKCFGCGEAGDVISFVRKTTGAGFREAVVQLARQFRVSLPASDDPEEQRVAGERERICQANAWAIGFFERGLREPGNPGMAYLLGRGLPAASIDAFRLGWAPDGWDGLLAAARQEGFAPDLLERAGLVVAGSQGRGPYDRFRNRVVFPIVDAGGRPVGFGARHLGGDAEGQPKYLNTPATAVFEKGATLYALDRARDAIRDQGRVAVMEGYTDVIRAHEKGVAWAVATLGTALTEEHARLLKRVTDTVVLVYDADSAGAKAADRGLDVFLKENFLVRVCTLPAGQDPCDFFGNADAAAFTKLAGEAEELVDYRLGRARSEGRFATVQGQTAVLREILATVAAVTDRTQQELLVKRISERTGVTEEALWGTLRGRARRTMPQSSSGTPLASSAPSASDAMERALLGVLLHDPMIVRAEDASRLEELVCLNESLGEAFRGAFLAGIAFSARGSSPGQQASRWDPQAFLASLAEDEEAKRLVVHAWDGADPGADHARIWRDCLERLARARREAEGAALRTRLEDDPDAFRRLVENRRADAGARR